MVKALEIEIYKMTKNRWFYVYLIIMGIVITGETVYAYNLWKSYHAIWELYGGFPSVLSMYWIGGDASSVFTQLYYILLPLMAVLPFSVTYYSEIKRGYMKNICGRTKRRNYILSKCLVSFFSGALACSCPLLFNLWITSLYVPNIPQNPMTFNSAIDNASMWGALFYENPTAYALGYTAVAFVFGGLFALLAMVVTYFCRNVFLYCLFWLLVDIAAYYVTGYSDYAKLVPCAFLNPLQIDMNADMRYIIAVAAAMTAISAVSLYRQAKKDILI